MRVNESVTNSAPEWVTGAGAEATEGNVSVSVGDTARSIPPRILDNPCPVRGQRPLPRAALQSLAYDT